MGQQPVRLRYGRPAGALHPAVRVQLGGVLDHAVGRGSEPRRYRVGGWRRVRRARHDARLPGCPVCRPLPVPARHRRRKPQRADRRVDQSRAGRARHRRPSLRARGLPGRSGLVFGALFFGVGLLSDIRSLAAPKGGIGMFFGTFNPFHNTHLAHRASCHRRARPGKGDHPSDADPAAACRRLPQGPDQGRPAGERLPDLREDRQGRCRRRLLSRPATSSCRPRRARR